MLIQERDESRRYNEAVQFLTEEECRKWLSEEQRDARGYPTLDTPGWHGKRGKEIHNAGRAWYLSQSVVPSSRYLLWVVETDIFHENLHLYYRMRESYGDRRLLYQAPGHQFLDYETADMASFLQIGIANGWDMFLLGDHDYGRLFVSHDEYYDVAFRSSDQLREFDRSAVSPTP